MADVKIEDGIIKVKDLDVMDPKAAAVLAEYPEVFGSLSTHHGSLFCGRFGCAGLA